MPPPLLATPPAGPAGGWGGGPRPQSDRLGGAKALDTPLPPEAQSPCFRSELVLQVGTLRLYAGKSHKLIF